MNDGIAVRSLRPLSSGAPLVILLVIFHPAGAESPPTVQVFEARQDEMSYKIQVRYEPVVWSPATLTVRVDLKNMSSDKPLPLNVVLREEGVFDLLRLKRNDAQTAWNFRFDYHWQYGDMHARHQDGTVYRLPFSRGMRCEVTQGYNGSFSHTGSGAFAVDFAMPEGTSVRAARQGWVVHTEDNVTTTIRNKPPGPDRNVPANEVVILHEDGTMGWYMHFRPGGVDVPEGRYVNEGDIIGQSGDTGLSSQPHLHFEVYRPVDGYVRQTIPVLFDVKGESRPIQLQPGRSYEPR